MVHHHFILPTFSHILSSHTQYDINSKQANYGETVGGTHNVLVHTMLLIMHQSYLVLSSATLSNEIFCYSVLIKNHTVCVPAITLKWFLCHNHRYRKFVGGTQSVPVHYVDDSEPTLSGVVLCNLFKWVILLFISGWKSGCCCVRVSTAKRILLINHRNGKVVGGTHNDLVHYVDDCAPNLSVVVLCNP